jgi:YEATS domain-containing protein 4
LKLYPEEDSGPWSTKKPIVAESYDEMVFAEPSEAFFARVQNHPAVIVPRLPAGLSLPPPGMLLSHVILLVDFSLYWILISISFGVYL